MPYESLICAFVIWNCTQTETNTLENKNPQQFGRGSLQGFNLAKIHSFALG
ncbi:unnamed protein product [Brassica rapa subsp. trilocularis]